MANTLTNGWDVVRDPKGIGNSTNALVAETGDIADTSETVDDRFKTTKNNLIAVTDLKDLQVGGSLSGAQVDKNNVNGVISTVARGSLADRPQENDITGGELLAGTAALTAGTNQTLALRTTGRANDPFASVITDVDGATRLRVTITDAGGGVISTGLALTIKGELVNSLFQPLNVISDTATGAGVTTVFNLSKTPAVRNGNNVFTDLDVNVVVDGAVRTADTYTVDASAKTVTFTAAPTTGDPSGNLKFTYVTVVSSTDDVTDSVIYNGTQTALIPVATDPESEAGITKVRTALADGTGDGAAIEFLTADLWISAKAAPTLDVGTTDTGVTVSIKETVTMVAKYTFDDKDVVEGTMSITSSAGGTVLKPDLTETGVKSFKFQVGLVATSDFSAHGKPSSAPNILVNHGSKLTFTYTDADPSTNVDTEDAWIDLKAPEISVLGVGDGKSTSEAEPRISVKLTDAFVTATAAAGITKGDIVLYLMRPGETVGTDRYR